jgi:cellulose synthase/poly-beta-1,6-N-acetylglucosamine synthase-like glycosyltransferase
MPIEYIIFICVTFYAIIYILILQRLTFDPSLSIDISSLNKNEPVKFSIIIAAKNEAENLGKLIPVLSKINYPEQDFEVIIVDDNSKDETFKRAKELISGLNNFSIVGVENTKYEGKRGALDYGISLAKYPNILITDADCLPEKNWLQYCSIKFDEGCEFLFGVAPFFQRKTLVNKISCFENFRNSILAFSAMNFGLPYSASARNFGFKKVSFEKIGGYKNTVGTISGDDDLLLREAVKYNLKICPLTSPGSFVYSRTKKSFSEYFSQRSRHTQTSFYYPLKQKLALTIWHSMNIAFIFSPLLISLSTLFAIPFFVKLIFDISTGTFLLQKFGYRFSIFEIIYLQIIYEIFLVLHIIKAKIGKIEWR